jgi:hypothetical protein
LKHLARIDHENEYILYNTGPGHRVQPHFRMTVLKMLISGVAPMEHETIRIVFSWSDTGCQRVAMVYRFNMISLSPGFRSF